MVFDAFFHPKRKIHVFLLGCFVAVMSGMFALLTFPKNVSVVLLFFTVFGLSPILYAKILTLEKKESELTLHAHFHSTLQSLTTFLLIVFFGVIAGYVIFESIAQFNDISYLTMQQSILPDTLIDAHPDFAKILWTNLSVLFVCIVLSLFYGSGAMFVLSYNASIVAAAIVNYTRLFYDSYGFASPSLSIIRYFSHGVFELTAFLLACIGASLLSYGFIHHSKKSKLFFMTVLHACTIFFVALVLLIIGAGVEAHLTPFIVFWE